MSELQQGGGPRLRRLRVLPGATPPDAAGPAHHAHHPVDEPGDDRPRPRVELVSVDGATSVPRVPPLDDLLRDVDALRASVRKDLSLAATALEAGEPALAGFLVEGLSDRLDGFATAASGDIARLEGLDPAPDAEEPVAVGAGPLRFVRSLLPKAPFAAAAALIALLAGPAVPDRVVSGTTQAAAVSSYHELTRLAAEGASDEEVLEAAAELHDRLAPIVAQAAQDPEAARQALVLLEAEQLVLMQGVAHSEVHAVLREARAMVRQLKRVLPRQAVRVPVVPDTTGAQAPKAEDDAREQSKSSPKPSPKASSRPSSSPSPKPSPSPSRSAESSPQPKPSGSEEPNGPLPDPLR